MKSINKIIEENKNDICLESIEQLKEYVWSFRFTIEKFLNKKGYDEKRFKALLNNKNYISEEQIDLNKKIENIKSNIELINKNEDMVNICGILILRDLQDIFKYFEIDWLKKDF